MYLTIENGSVDPLLRYYREAIAASLEVHSATMPEHSAGRRRNSPRIYLLPRAYTCSTPGLRPAVDQLPRIETRAAHPEAEFRIGWYTHPGAHRGL